MTATQLAVFKGKQIRRHWDEDNEKWFFSIIDIVEVLTGSSIPKRYWSDLKRKLKQEGRDWRGKSRGRLDDEKRSEEDRTFWGEERRKGTVPG